MPAGILIFVNEQPKVKAERPLQKPEKIIKDIKELTRLELDLLSNLTSAEPLSTT